MTSPKNVCVGGNYTSGPVELQPHKSRYTTEIVTVIIALRKRLVDWCATKVAHLFRRTKNTATTTPTADRQNANTSDTTSTVLCFSTPLTLSARGPGLFLNDLLGPRVSSEGNCDDLESSLLWDIVGEVVVVLLLCLSFSCLDSKIDVVLFKLVLLFAVPLFICKGVEKVVNGSFSKRKKMILIM